jgi:hypothetical protein
MDNESAPEVIKSVAGDTGTLNYNHRDISFEFLKLWPM